MNGLKRTSGFRRSPQRRGGAATAGLFAALLAGLLLPLHTSPGQGSLSTLQAGGPISNRVNLVVLSEGYTSGQLGQFLVDATNLVNRLLSTAPLDAYRDYFNAYAISVASPQSGASHPSWSKWVTNYFNSVYENDAEVALITIPPNSYNPHYSNGQGRVDALVTNLMPQADLILLLVNDSLAGGSSGLGGTNGVSNRRPIITSLNFPPTTYDPQRMDIPAHETGHFFAGLVDEYTAGAPPGYVPSEAPNSTQQTSRNLIKWKAWIDPATPIPTFNDPTNAGVVGLFQGSQYRTSGWYRPKYDCKMHHLGVPFCDVCGEQIIRTIYQHVRPMDAVSPTNGSLTVVSTQSLAFTVTSPQPRTHDLTFHWFTNNVPVAGATHSTFQVSPRGLGNGNHSVRVTAQDTNIWVRTALPAATNTWTLAVSLNELQIVSPAYLSGGRFRFTVTGAAPHGFVIQASTNFIQWARLSTNTLAGGKFDYTNSGLGSVPFRFYRTLSPP